ncbi:TonB-dependent receptor [Bacteroides pyogenes JCM 10003]|nr:TonB-dependent receptor [Bacteroides pyogenes JCM 10003]
MRIKGRVTDRQTGEPIIGVTVFVPGTSHGTTTDIDGNYSLNVPLGSTVTFSYIGYADFNREVREEGVLDVVLTEDAVTLDDVVVVGYGVQKKVNLTGAVSMVKGDAWKTVRCPI